MKFLSKILVLVVLVLNSAFVSAQKQPLSPVEKHGALSVKGTHLVNAEGETISLRGMSFGWHVWWPQFWNAETVEWLDKDWNCTVVRAAMGIEPDGGFLSDPEKSKELLCKVVDAAIDQGLYVIIDWHDHHASAHTQQAKAFFVEMAQKYGSHPNVIYEIYNEPEREEWSSVKAYAEELIKAIRAVDPDNLILVGSPHWDQDIHLVAEDPIQNVSHVMYTLHFYAATHKQWLRDRATEAIEKGLPLFVSEYGASEATGDGPLDYEQWKLWTEWMEKHQVSWCVWSISDKQESSAVLNPRANPKGNWTEAELSAAGKHARKLIQEHNSK